MTYSSDVLKKLFGRPVRVYLAIWILGHAQTFYLQEAQVALQAQGQAPSATRDEVLTLRDCGLLLETAIGGRKYYTAATSPWWAVFEAIAQVFEGSMPSASDNVEADRLSQGLQHGSPDSDVPPADVAAGRPA